VTAPKSSSRNRLRKVRLREVSLVDNPANPHARVVLFKAASRPGAGISFEDAYRALSTALSTLLSPHSRSAP